MKAKMSLFLEDSKPILRKLLKTLQLDFNYVSILASDTFGTSYRVTINGVDVKDSMWNERGFVVRVHNGINYSEFSFNELNKENIDDIISKITTTLNLQKDIIRNNLVVNEYPLIHEEPIKRSFIGEVKIHPDEINVKEKLKKMSVMLEKAKKVSNELVDFKISYTENEISKLYISGEKELEQAYIFSEGYLFPTVRRGDKTKDNFKGHSGLKAVELLDEMEASIVTVIKDAIELLDSEPIIPGEYEIICSPEITGLIVHEAFGHGVEMDMFVKDRAKAVNYIGKYVASPLITMHDGGIAAKDVSSYMFDDEGTLATDTVIIKAGILETGMSDLLSAMKLGTVPTGNGKRSSFERKAYTRMTNTFFTPGENTLEEMISSLKYGFLLEGMESGMEDPKNWGIQCMLKVGREIKDGHFTGKVVSPVILTGYVPDLLSSISMISKDFELFGCGACGKGYKEYVKVSDGGPYIKAKARLG